MSGLFMDVGLDDALCIGGNTYITLEKKSGQRARLRIIGTQEVELLKQARKKAALRPLNPPSSTDGS